MTLNDGYAIFRNLSVDVALGGIASGAMVVWMLDANMPWIWWVALPMAVWVIYTTDHLLDAYRLKEKAHTPRHLFHHKYFKPIRVVWVLGMVSCLTWVVYFSPKELIFLGFGMGGLVILHLGLVWLIGNRVSWMFHKELGVGLIYTLGVWGGPMVLSPEKVDIVVWLFFIQFLLMALINLLVFSQYEAQTDEKDGQTSFVLAIGPQRTRFLVTALLALSFVIGLYLFRTGISYRYAVVQAMYGCMLVILAFVAFVPSLFGPRERYRAWADGAFIIPALVWLC
jgi:4-hydroxybenzoate polyprenyltransferase